MQIEERTVGDVMVLDLKGKITLGEGDELLKDKVNSLVNQGHKKIVLNLADVPYIDSAGLGEIVRTYTTVSRQGGSLKLLNLTKRITDLLSITKLLTVFETFDSESEAVRSFSASAEGQSTIRARWRAALPISTVADAPDRDRRGVGAPLARAQPARSRFVPASGRRTCSSSPALLFGRQAVRPALRCSPPWPPSSSSARCRASSTWSTTSPIARPIGSIR